MVHAQIYKKVTYNVHLKIANEATIEVTHANMRKERRLIVNIS